MKKIAMLLLALITLTACSVDENEAQFYYEVLPVESFTVPESVNFGQDYEIIMTYKRPTTCHFYEGCYYQTEDYSTIVGIQTYVMGNGDCETLENQAPLEVRFNFRIESVPSTTQPYIFKFYKGKDENGNDIFEEVQIPVNYY